MPAQTGNHDFRPAVHSLCHDPLLPGKRGRALLPERLLRTLGHHNGWHELQLPLKAEGYLIYRKNNPKLPLIRPYVEQVLASFAQKPGEPIV